MQSNQKLKTREAAKPTSIKRSMHLEVMASFEEMLTALRGSGDPRLSVWDRQWRRMNDIEPIKKERSAKMTVPGPTGS